MQLSQRLIAKFQKVYLEHYDEVISAEVAEAELLSLAELVAITQKPIKPITKENEDGQLPGTDAATR